jgi:GNAT superfamily N-acetyltransferase
MYFDYLLEREGYHSIVTDSGFATFKLISPEVCYLRDIYVKPEFRKTKVGTDIHNQVVSEAVQRGASILLGSVCLDAPSVDRSIKAMYSVDMSFSHKEGNMLYFKKEIK